MTTTLVRTVSAGLLVLALAGCANTPPPPAAAAPSTAINPITGSRGSGAGK